MDGKRPLVLIVDDEPVNVQILAGILRDAYDVSHASDGEEALRACERDPPDLVLLDVMLPGMSGYEVCGRIKANPVTRAVPVVFVTARDDEGDEARGLELGGADYIAKPVSAPIVRARVRIQLQLKRYRDELERLSWCDGLTGIPNRRRLDAFLAHEWQRGIRAGQPLSLALADIDWFKSYNDAFGHVVGDDCLRAVAAALKSALTRSTDIVARYGGEEFACVMPETGEHGARLVGERLRRAVADLGLRAGPGAIGPVVTVSVGVATRVPAPGTTERDLVAAADRVLYAAKEGGRNRLGGVEPASMQEFTLA